MADTQVVCTPITVNASLQSVLKIGVKVNPVSCPVILLGKLGINIAVNPVIASAALITAAVTQFTIQNPTRL